MHHSPNIILIGMPGAGKSTIGQSLATTLNRPLLDTDQLLVEKLGKSIARLIETEGEAAFRQAETTLLTDLTASHLDQTKPWILATGGGIILTAKNRKILHQLGTIIYLSVRPCALLDRMANLSERPLLRRSTAETLAAGLEQLYQIRDPLYRTCADWVINNETPDPHDTSAKILALCQKAYESTRAQH